MKRYYFLCFWGLICCSCTFENSTMNKDNIIGDFRAVNDVNDKRAGLILAYDSPKTNSYLPLVKNCCEILYNNQLLLVKAFNYKNDTELYSIFLSKYKMRDNHRFQNHEYPQISSSTYDSIRTESLDLKTYFSNCDN